MLKYKRGKFMRKTMIVLDLDNTLLRNDKSLSDYSIEVLKKYQKNGGIITLATGRLKLSSEEFAKMVNAAGLVTSNGGFSYYQDELINEINIDKENTSALVRELLMIEQSFLAIAYPTKILTNNKEFVKAGWREYSDFSEYSCEEIQKISVFTKNHQGVKNTDLSKYDCKWVEFSDDPNYFVVAHSSIDKCKGVQAICDNIGIDLKDVIAFGDDFNDKEMLVQCGKGIAVSNAIDFIKNLSDEICDSNENDGPAKWIAANLLK